MQRARSHLLDRAPRSPDHAYKSKREGRAMQHATIRGHNNAMEGESRTATHDRQSKRGVQQFVARASRGSIGISVYPSQTHIEGRVPLFRHPRAVRQRLQAGKCYRTLDGIRNELCQAFRDFFSQCAR